MGVTHVTVVIRNPADPEKTWEGLFLVDTGAIDCLVPRPHLEAIGLKPKGQRVYGWLMAVISKWISRPGTSSYGEIVGGTIVFGRRMQNRYSA